MPKWLLRICIVVALAAIAPLAYLHYHHNGRLVLVAKREIQKGTSGDIIGTRPGYFRATSVPTEQIETGAILSPWTLIGKVAVKNIQPGEQLTAAEFSSCSGCLGGPSERAVTLASPKEIGGPITAGSHVDVLAASNGHRSRLLLRNMYVLSTNNDAVTLGATLIQAGNLIHLAGTANHRLVVRREPSN